MSTTELSDSQIAMEALKKSLDTDDWSDQQREVIDKFVNLIRNDVENVLKFKDQMENTKCQLLLKATMESANALGAANTHIVADVQSTAAGTINIETGFQKILEHWNNYVHSYNKIQQEVGKAILGENNEK